MNKLLTALLSSALVIILLSLILICATTRNAPTQVNQSFGLDTGKDGTIYGDTEGIKRVKLLEEQFHNMKVREDHPRIILNAENLLEYRSRMSNHPSWKYIKKSADNGDMVNAAFVYQIIKDIKYADIAIQKALSIEIDKNYKAPASLVFDWCYYAMTEEQRKELMNKIVQAVGYFDNPIPENKFLNTFHTEEWSPYSSGAWPEIALAHHYPKAEDWYKARWQYDWVWGDGARAIAYIGDGNRLECYPHYGVQLQWFLVLRSATGINIIDSPDIPYYAQAGYLLMYKTDFGTKRYVFFKGANSAGSIVSYEFTYKERYEFGVTGSFSKNPFVKWGMERIGANDGLYNFGAAIDKTTKDIWNFIIYDNNIKSQNPNLATLNEFPLSRIFPTSKKAIMRSSWGDNSIIIGFRNLDFKAQWHVAADANTFYIYRKGLLSGENGCRGSSGNPAHSSYWQYAAISHNDLLVIDPNNPKFPTGSQGDTKSNSGGPETITSHNFGMPYRNPMLHDYKRQQPGGIPVFRASPEYTYLVGDATEAYRSRLNEFFRNMVFIPLPGDKGYFIVFDRVETKKPELIKKWLLHFCDMPKINGNKVSEEVPEHIESFDGDFISANNVKNTSTLYVKTLLPKNRVIRRIGGEGYECWRDDMQTNYKTPCETSYILKVMGGQDITDVKELGFARVEISPTEKQNRDYFLNVMYIGEPGDTVAPMELVEKDDWVGVVIKDPKLKNNEILFTKTGNPDCQITSNSEQLGKPGKPKHIEK